MKKLLLSLFCLTLFPFLTLGQISGRVVDTDGEPVLGAIVQISSTRGSNLSIGGQATAITDIDGYFEIDVAAGTELEVVLLGYKSEKLTASDGMRVVLMKKGQKKNSTKKEIKKSDEPWKMLVLANGMTSAPFSPAIGATIGIVKKGGWYVSFLMGFGNHYKFDKSLMDGLERHSNGLLSEHYYEVPFYTGKKTYQTVSLTAGGMAQLGSIPLYLYAGLGYGYRSMTAQTNNGSWVAIRRSDKSWDYTTCHSLALETGLTGNIKGFAVSVGYELMIGTNMVDSTPVCHEIKIGIGGMFNLKRRAEK